MKTIRSLLMLVGYAMFLVWALGVGHDYSLRWGFWGWVGGLLFFIPITLYSLFLFLISGQFGLLVVSVIYLALAFLLVVKGQKD